MAGVPPWSRPVHMMFQSYALFPHMTVEKNIAYGLKHEAISKAAKQDRVREMLDLVQLTAICRAQAASDFGRAAAAGGAGARAGAAAEAACFWTNRWPHWTRSCASIPSLN